MKKIMQHSTASVPMQNLWQDALLLIPRITCGWLLAVNFGASKFGMPWSPTDKNLGLFEVAFWFPNDVADYGGVFAAAPALLAWLAACSEAVGGILLAFGFQTRLVSFLLLCTMLVAAFVQHSGGEMWNKLPALGFAWVATLYLAIGGGKFSIDYLINKKLGAAANGTAM
jgi:putative oxidoreductase